MPTSADFIAGIEKAVVNMARLDEFINEGTIGTVATDNGDIPNLRKVIDDFGGTGSTPTDIEDITGLQDALDAKAAASHTQAATTVTIDDGSSGTKFTTVQGYRAYLLGNAGASQIGFIRDGRANTADVLLKAAAVTPEEFGAVALEDGAPTTTSQTTALTAALNSGRLVDCRGKSYNIGTPIAPTGTVKGIVNGNFAWTTTTAMSAQQFMLTVIDKDDLKVTDNSFNLGTVENTGTTNDSSRGAVKITSSNEGVAYIKRPCVERNKVTGAGNGTPIYVRSAISPRVNYNIVHDRVVTGSYTTGSGQDIQNGIDVSRSTDVQCEGNIVDGLYYRISGSLVRAWSRGIVAVEVTGGSYSSNFVSNVDQGMDFSGGIVAGFPNGNTALACKGNVVHDVRTWGIKFANCARNSVASGNVIRNYGWGGIVISGQSSAGSWGDKPTSHLLITGNYVFDPADYYGRTDCIGIWVIFRTAYPGYPSQIRITGNTICNTTGNGRLLHGISQDDGDGAHNVISGAPYNEVTDNKIIGQTGTPTKGCFPDGVCALTGSSSQSIPNATWTAVAWNSETVDGEGMHDNSTNPERGTVLVSGWYQVGYTLVYAANATGFRQARIIANGGTIPGGDSFNGAGDGTITPALNASAVVYIPAGNHARIETWQSSSDALNLNRPNSQFYMRRIEQM